MTRSRGDDRLGTATRLRVRRWTDPRLLLGVLLVVGATVAGARVVAAADDSQAYWSVSAPARAGDPVQKSALTTTEARLSGGVGQRYLLATDDFPAPLDDLVWSHDVEEGALLGRDDLTEAATQAGSDLPLAVEQGAFPADLRRGDEVDVWVGPGPGDDESVRARRVLSGVRVASAKDGSTALGGASTRTVLVEVDGDALLPSVVSTVASGHVTLVRLS